MRAKDTKPCHHANNYTWSLSTWYGGEVVGIALESQAQVHVTRN